MTKPTRKSVSITGELYSKLREHCDLNNIPMSGLVESLARAHLDIDQKDDKAIRSYWDAKSPATYFTHGAAWDGDKIYHSPPDPNTITTLEPADYRAVMASVMVNNVLECHDHVDDEKLKELRKDQEPEPEQLPVPPPSSVYDYPSAEHDPTKGMSEAERADHEKRKKIAERTFTF